MQKPKIFVFTTAYLPFIGGAEIAISEVSKRLKSRFDFCVIASRMKRNLPEREVKHGIIIRRVGLGTALDKFFLPVLGSLAVRKEYDKNANAVFWGVDLSFGSLGAAVSKIFHPKIPLVFTVQYGYGDERIASGRLGTIRFALRFILNKSDLVTSISAYLLGLIHRYGYIGEEAVIPNGTDLKKFSEARNEHQTSSNIITVSRLVPKNGVDILIRAVYEIRKHISDIKLHILGDGEERKNLEELSKKLGLAGAVKFFGNVPYDKLPEYLADADVFVRPSRSEGMGNAFVEALAAGLPIVGTPVGGIPDIIKDGETGLFSKVADPKDLAEKIQFLLNDRKLAEKIVENGRRLVAEKFEWNNIAERYADVFKRKLGTKKKILIATGIFPPDVGGPATYSKILLGELPKNGFGVRVLNFGGVKYFPKAIRHFIYFLRVLRLGRNADIIFAQDPVSVGLPAMFVAKILRKKFILKIVGDYAWEQGVQRFGVREVLDDFLKKRYGFKVEALRKIEKFVASRADKIIVPSEYLEKVVIQWGINPEKFTVIYNAFELPRSDELFRFPRPALLARGLPLRQLLTKPAQQPIASRLIVSAGRLVPWKGFDTLIEIMPELAKKFPDVKLVIIGDGPEWKTLKGLARSKFGDASEPPERGLSARNLVRASPITFIGNLSHEKVLEYLAAADVFVLNTAYEGFSHQILEAMALGVPVVTTNIGGNPELIQNGESGFLLDFNDKNAFIEKILEILANPALAHKFSEKAQKKAQEFSLERMIRNTVDILNKK